MPADVAVGLDLGTSGLKAVAIDAGGRVLAQGAAPYPTARPEPGAAEQDPEGWLRAADAALAQVAQAVAPDRWGAIGLSAMLPTLVATDHSGAPVHPAVTWEDARAEPEARALLEAFGEDHLYRTTGQRIDGRYLLPMFQRLRARGVAAERLLGAKDWLVGRLTGRWCTDPSTAAGTGAFPLESGTWDDGLLAWAGGPLVPDVVDPATPLPLLPDVTARWGCASGTPLVVGAADSVLGAHGMGVRAPGTIALVLGTSAVVLAPAATPATDPAARCLVTPAIGSWARETDLVATGSAFAWLARLLGAAGPGALLELAQDAPLEDAPVVLPYVGPGEQGALWDPSLVGVASGLTLRTGAAELALGLLAGVVVELARCIDVLGDGALVASGNGADPVLLQALADAVGTPVSAFTGEQDHSALGAAHLAGATVLGFPGTAPAPDTVFAPDPAMRQAWRERTAAHEHLRLARRLDSTAASITA